MEWEIYKNRIIDATRDLNLSEEYLNSYLLFAKNLFDKNLPIIVKPSHLSDLIGIEHNYICSMAYAQEHFYRHFCIKKTSGKIRNINEPLPDLKKVQKWILNEILYKIPISNYAKAFVPEKSIKENARFHRKQNVLLTIDIKDFFPSIKIYEVYEVFKKAGYSTDLSSFMANLCCLDGELPQGAPTSPYLSNLVMRDIDVYISEYCQRNKIRYTRYADDMSFSGDFDPNRIIRIVSDRLYSNGYTLNPDKTRVARKNARQEVTGIVVNSHMQLPKNVRKDIRQQIYYIKKYGLESHLLYKNEKRANYSRHLLGQINFGLFVNPNDKELKSYFKYMVNII
ncbi:MAG: retron St85 family RNA-directed DNA polymerase [Acidaminococcaceae bacterium]